MAYKALYRTYRPSTFDEVAGQQHIVRTLKNALANNKIAHAYLFAGPRGTGKTSMAKLFAKALNCEEGLGHQCNNCKNCKAIIDGNHPDVLELDAASNNSVANIRDLTEKVRYGTFMGKYKVYIIDEVHMLSNEAFNALLKTLEEPPAHVIFILATTEPNGILPTILSRCQRYDFTKISLEDMIKRMKEVLEHEKIIFEDEAVKLVASLADGGMRDALSMLDQIIAYSTDGKLKTVDVLDIFSLESVETKTKLLSLVAQSNTPEVLKTVHGFFAKGTDIKRLTSDLLYILKDTYVYLITRGVEGLTYLNETQALELSKLLDEDKVSKMIEILMNTLKGYRNVSSINPIFEVSILNLCATCAKRVSAAKNEENTEKHTQNSTEKVKPIEAIIEKEPEPIVAEHVVTSMSKEYKKVNTIIALKNTIKDGNYVIPNDLMIKVMVKCNKDAKKEFVGKWNELRKYTVHPILGGAASNLADAHPLVASNDILVLEYPLAIMADKMNKVEVQEELQNVIFNALGKHVFVYSVSRKQSVDYQQMYNDLIQIGKLPKADSINLDFEGDK